MLCPEQVVFHTAQPTVSLGQLGGFEGEIGADIGLAYDWLGV